MALQHNYAKRCVGFDLPVSVLWPHEHWIVLPFTSRGIPAFSESASSHYPLSIDIFQKGFDKLCEDRHGPRSTVKL